MAYPEIDMPMYEPLVDLSAELFLPNINLIEQNSITLLETNQRFIEAYMVGLNHEFARELLWREYPTDQRGSYFRQFWDVAQLPRRATAGRRGSCRRSCATSRRCTAGRRASKLGDHDHREQPGENEEELVLVIRGELLKKYPNAVIYAHRADVAAETTATSTATSRARLVRADRRRGGDPPRRRCARRSTRPRSSPTSTSSAST